MPHPWFNRRFFQWFSGVFIVTLLAAARFAHAQVSQDTGAPIDPTLAIRQFSMPDGFQATLWASEPQLRNPVAFCFDEKGRMFLAETFRYKVSVLDIRDYMSMYYDDLASRTVEDRARLIEHYFGNNTPAFTQQTEVVQLLEDRAGTGRADSSSVYADGFNSILDGIGAGVLSRKGTLYYTCIPNLWMLQETNRSGKAGVRTSLSYGYGVHFGYTGHDLHGLRLGPDGKLYFSIGDRALNVFTREGKTLDYSEMGSVLRCNQDGSDLEVYAYGLRNPQGLAFDDFGNLFTGDNNCDHGDAARIVYVEEGSDTGWRNAYQFSETQPAAGLWNSEKLWHLQFPEQAAYLIPPIAHLGDGPAGFTHYPGTGFPDSYKNHFFMADFRGASPKSGIHSLAMTPSGAGFTVVDTNHFLWHVLATHVDFSPDGALYISDWVRSWSQSNLGRVYRVADTNLIKSPLVVETRRLIGDGMTKRPVSELQALLAHPDQRVRQEAQFELADRAMSVASNTSPVAAFEALQQTALKGTNLLARLHGIWGIGQIGRTSNQVMGVVLPLLKDRQFEVRAQTAKVLGDAKFPDAFAGLTNALTDPNLHVRLLAAISLGKLGNRDAAAPLLAMLRENADRDTYLRHAGVMGLLGTTDEHDFIKSATAKSRAERIAAVLTLRRMRSDLLTNFLHDADVLVMLEAARAINDLPIRDALPALAALSTRPSGNELLDWRSVNANYRLGEATNAANMAAYAANTNAPEKIRVEAMELLARWINPGSRDRVTGLWRPLAIRDHVPAVQALRPVIDQIVRTAPAAVALMAVVATSELGMTEATPLLEETAKNLKTAPDVRVAALKVLARFSDPDLTDIVRMAVVDKNEDVRSEGHRLQANLSPADAAKILGEVLEQGTVSEKQAAFATLKKIPEPGVDKLFVDWMGRLEAGKVPKEIQLDLLAAASAREAQSVKDKLGEYVAKLPKDDEFSGYRETLYGGDAEAGKKVFQERQDVSCVRCHKIDGQGGNVGPDLTGIGTRHDREYILESILYPNKQIAPGYESVLLQMKDGAIHSGMVRSQDGDYITIMSNEENVLEKLKKSEIKSAVKSSSGMPEGLGFSLSKYDLRNLVEFLATVK